jgi:hypothetical protein
VDFSEASELFVNIFQNLGPNYKFMDCGLILEKQRGFFAKWRGISAGIYFSTDKSVDRLGALGPLWTDGGADRGGAGRGGALIGARPSAAPVCQSSPAGAQ